jgi:hypothetical protein
MKKCITFGQFIEKDIDFLYDKLGCFFAYNAKQFNEAKKEGVKYIRDGVFFCPKDSVQEYQDQMKYIYTVRKDEYVKEFGAVEIILCELLNHEFGYTGSLRDTKEALTIFSEAYPDLFTKEAFKEAVDKYWELEDEL